VLIRRFGTLGIATLLALMLTVVLATNSSATSSSRQVQVRDDCEPVSFNAAVGPGTCVKDGTTTFQEFVALLAAHTPPAAWRFAPDQLSLAAGGTLEAQNRGGEFHTFTEVANFGGGCIGFLNALLGLTPVPECGTPGILFATGLPAGGTLTTGSLPPGLHRFECLIHPWMRTSVTVS
jgi:plastocyanin